MATRATLQRAGAGVLEELLALPEPFPPQVPCGCGQPARYQEMRRKQLVTVLGRVETERPDYRGPHCHHGQSPRDQELQVEGVPYSPGVQRMMAAVGRETSFERGRQPLELLAGVKVTTKAIERQAEAIGAEIAAQEQEEIRQGVQLELPQVPGPEIPVLYIEMDATGVPVVASQTEGRPGKEGEQARTRDAKLGCVFTQTTVKGRPVRDEASTTSTGGIETAEEFGRRIYVEACHRGWNRAQKKVVIGDGAPWIWNVAAEHFPGAVEIVDLYHARQHLWELAKKLWPTDERQRLRWAKKWQKRLDGGRIESLVRGLRFLSVRFFLSISSASAFLTFTLLISVSLAFTQ